MVAKIRSEESTGLTIIRCLTAIALLVIALVVGLIGLGFLIGYGKSWTGPIGFGICLAIMGALGTLAIAIAPELAI